MAIGLASIATPYSTVNIGNPNIAVTAIDVSGGIACSRTSGATPFIVQVSASAIAASGAIDLPYEDLEYRWNFGDPSGSERFTRPTDGSYVNPNNDQTGPEAAYCYRSAGTYTITLSIRGKTTSGYITATATQNVTVTAHATSDVVYFDSNAPGGGDGTTASTAYNTIAKLSDNTFWPSHKTDCVIRLAKGSSWTGSAGLRVTNSVTLAGAMSGLRVESYQGSYSASSAKPVIDVSSDSGGSNLGAPCHFGATSAANSGWTKTDFVVSGIRFTNSTGSSSTFNTVAVISPGTSAIASMTDIYFDNCELESFVRTSNAIAGLTDIVAFGNISTAAMSRMGFWGGLIHCPVTTSTVRLGLLGGAPENWYLVFGLDMSGAGGSNTLDHFIYPECQTHALYKWVKFGETGTGAGQFSFCVNLNWNGTTTANGGANGGFAFADYHCISECDASSATNPPRLFCDGNQSANATCVFTGGGSPNIVVTGSTPSTGVQVVFFTSGALPSGVQVGTAYWVVSSSGSSNGTITVSATNGGSAITFASAGTGTQTLGQVLFRNFVIERCGMKALGGNGLYQGNACLTNTFRDNRVWNYTAGNIYQPAPKEALRGKYYRNKIDSPSGLQSFANYLNMPTGWLAAQQFTDNVIVDRRAAVTWLTLDWTNMQVNGTNIARNKYYTDGTSAFFDNVTSKTFAQTQAAGFESGSTLQAISAAPWASTPTVWSDFG